MLMAAILFCGRPALAANTKEYVVFVAATVTEDPPSITLSWAAEPKATGYQISRKLRSDAAWGPPVSLSGVSNTWTDGTVTVGVKYEYQVRRTSTITGAAGPNLISYGYLCAGIRIPPVDRRGTVVLVVDNSKAASLGSELRRLGEDLVGDGWFVIRHDVAPTASVKVVKTLIKADYDAAPDDVRSVFLFGHVPVPRSGNYAPGGHPDVHSGAFPADLYYGEMDGIWTDTTVNNKTADSSLSDCWNVPGDGKFDASYVPGLTPDFLPGGKVELEVGRVDLWGMTSFLPKSETELLRQYLNKDHAHRHAASILPQKALITDNVGEFDGKAYAQGGWRSWGSLFGAGNVSSGAFATLKTTPYFGYYMNGAGDNNWCEPIHTIDFAKEDPKTAFVMMYGSHFSDWNKAENILRAPLCTSNGLASVYSGIPHWFLHTMSLGGSFGEATRLVQNNFYTAGAPTYPIVYNPPSSFVGGIHLSLHGDPTLRLTAIAPPSALVITQNASDHPLLSWSATANPESVYHVYRSASTNGPFTRLTSEPTTLTTYTDSSVSSGTFCYQVKAAKLETTVGGTFINTSQAASASMHLRDLPRPALTAFLVEGLLNLSWPTLSSTYRLQTTGLLAEGSEWRDITEAQVTNGDLISVSLPTALSTRYFRLVKP